MRCPARLAVGGVVLLAAVACAADAPDREPGTRTPSGSGSVGPRTGDPAPPDAGPAPQRRSRRPVTIAVAGDVHFEGVLRERLARPATALAPVTSSLAAADVAVVNLETSLGTGGRPEPGKRFPFQAPNSALTALAEAGVDVATMANNHALDFGREPLPDVFRALERARRGRPPLAVVGLGRDVRTAYEPALAQVGRTTVTTLGATVADQDPTADPTGQWAATRSAAGTADALDPGRLLRAVTSADRSADVVVVYLHWGVQGERCPSSDQRSLATDVVQAGADVVVGSHAHLLQGDGRLGEGYVAYGLGNYAWYTSSPPESPATGVLTLTVRPPRTASGRARVVRSVWEGARIGADGLPRPLGGADAERFAADVAGLRACAGLARRGP